MMEETRLFDINSIELNELFDSVRMELKNKNDDYKKLKKQYHDIMDRFPNLQLIFEDDEVFELNKEECKMLQKIIQLGLKIDELEEYSLFFLGGKETYFYFKKIGILKE